MNAMIPFFLKVKPVFLELSQPHLSFINGKLLHQLVAAKHVPSYLRVVANMLVINFHLLKASSIRISYKVEAVASGRSMPHDNISLIVFKNQMKIKFLINFTLFAIWPNEVVRGIFYRDSLLIKITRLCSCKHFA
jgi:hypothetical protein